MHLENLLSQTLMAYSSVFFSAQVCRIKTFDEMTNDFTLKTQKKYLCRKENRYIGD